MPVRRSHGRINIENGIRERDHKRRLVLQKPAETEGQREAKTGRFAPGNRLACKENRAVKLKALKPELVVGLNIETASPWLRPYIKLALEHAKEIALSLPSQEPALVALATNAAGALAMHRAFLQLGMDNNDMKAFAEARAWLLQHRQLLLTLDAMSRESAAVAKMQANFDPLSDIVIPAERAVDENKSD